MSVTATTTPQVWLGCLRSYNEGELRGRWVDAVDEDEMAEALQETLAGDTTTSTVTVGGQDFDSVRTVREPGEEWYVGDYDGFGDLSRVLGEYPSLTIVAKIGTLIEKHGEAFIAWIDTLDYGTDLSEVDEDTFYEHYRGEWDSEKDFAMENVCEVGWCVPTQLYVSKYDDKTINVLDELACYLDWDCIATELFQHGNYTFHKGYVFEDEV